METSNNISNPRQNLESSFRNDDGTFENDFHFGYLTLESSADLHAARAPLGTPDAPTVPPNDFEGDDIPTFYETIPSLQEMSSLVVAISLWRRVISLQHNSTFDSVTKISDEDVLKLLLELPVPRLIREIIKYHLPGLKIEMENWLCYYNHNLFTTKRGACEGTSKFNAGDLLLCSWLPDGKIGHRESALNMLSSPRLTQADKFTIMGRYCLEDEMKNLSAESLPSNFRSRINLRTNALMYYWLCYVKGDLDQIPMMKGEPIVSHLITAFNVDNWLAIEYFWLQLNSNEQISKFEKIVIRRPELQKNLLSKMNEMQKFHLFSKTPLKIIENFWRVPGYEKFAFQTWIYTRNFFDYDQFTQIMRKLTTTTSSKDEAKVRYLVDIWNHTPGHLKKLAYQPSFVNIIMDFISIYYYYRPSRNIEFLLAYLSGSSAKIRKRIIFERAHALIGVLLDASVNDQLIKLCLPNAKDVVKFTKYLLEADFTQVCLLVSLRDNDFECLNTFLSYFCPDLTTRTDFFCKILDTFTLRGYEFYKLSKWINIMNFIDENLLHTLPDQAFKFKKRTALSFAGFCCELWSNDDEMAKMIEIVTQVLDAEELGRFKLKALERVQGRYRWDLFDENLISASILWCCDNDERRVREFKEALLIDDIFETIWYTIKWNRTLQNDVDQETVGELFEPLDRCLLWYFEDAESVKKFKLQKVFGYCDRGSSMFFRNNYARNDVFARNTLPWFFEGDRGAIELFKEMYNDQEISKMI